MTVTAQVDGNATALGETTLTVASTAVTVTEGGAAGDGTLTAIGNDDDVALAETSLSSSTSVTGDDGSGVEVETYTYAIATGDTALAYSTTDTFAISTSGADVAVGQTFSYASGDEFYDTDALVEPHGDITASGGSDMADPISPVSIAVGIAVDLPVDLLVDSGLF